MRPPLLFGKAHTFAFEDRWEWLLSASADVKATVYRDGAWEIWITCDGGQHCLCEHEKGGPEDAAREIERILRCASGAVPQ